MSLTDERIARNNATFRAANERIRESAKAYELTEGPLPFICERADETCTTVIQVPLEGYAEVREHARRFLVATERHVPVEGEGRVVEETGAYVVFEKTGPRRGAAGGGLMDDRAARIGRNEALFRRVNEQIETLNDAFGSLAGTMAWVCECGDRECLEQIELTPAEYERVRAEATQFVVKPGHELPEVEDVIAETDRFLIVRKVEGLPAQMARDLE